MSLAIFFTVLCFKPKTFQNILSCLGLSEEHLYKHRPFPLNANRLITSSVGLRHLNFSRTVFWILLFKSHSLLDFNPLQWYQIDWRTQTPVGRASHVPMLYPGEGPTETKFMSRPTHSCEKSQAIYTALKNTKGLDSPKVNSPGEVGQILVKLKYFSFSMPAAPFSRCPIAHLLTALPQGVSNSSFTYIQLQTGDFRADQTNRSSDHHHAPFTRSTKFWLPKLISPTLQLTSKKQSWWISAIYFRQMPYSSL